MAEYASCFSFLQYLCCGTVRAHKRGKAPPDEDKVRVRVRIGFDGKDSLMDADDMNVRIIFGSFAVLLDSDNQLVPLDKYGSPVEPLSADKRYVVVVNTHGSCKNKWDAMTYKGKKHKHRHSKKKRSSKQSSPRKESMSEEKSCNGSDESKVPLMSRECKDSYVTKDFAVASMGQLIAVGGDSY